MQKSTDMTNVTTLAPMARRGVAVPSHAPTITVGHRVADNDANLDDAADSRHEIDAWARRAHAANGFGDAATVDSAASAWPSNYELYRAARANRAFVLGEMMASAVRSVRALVRLAYRRYRQYRHESALYDTLSQLDDRTLRDLGFDRSEIRSVAAEWAGEAAPTRVRVLHSPNSPWAVDPTKHAARASEFLAAD
jgi:uncharacterized protein YjiS (DUF1127 family)